MEALSADKWSICLDSEGRVLDQYTVRKIVFHKGISEEIRREVWLFLLGYYPFGSTSEERKTIDHEKRIHYESLLASWRDSSDIKSSPSSSSDDFEEYSKIIEKDSIRTDRCLEFFNDANIHNVFTLERILKTFILLRPDIGYVQGMSDILALPLVILNNEHQAFWCFDYIMNKTQQGVVFTDLTLTEPLENLSRLCHHIDKPLYDHLNIIYEGEQWLFTYRLIVLNFKRELSIECCSRLWECFWSCHATEHFPLLFTVAVLIHFKHTLLQYTNFEQLMQFSQSLRGKIPVNEVLSRAIELLEQLNTDDYCPYDIKFLVSNQVSAPPPLVGFVRTRQKVTSLYSNKIEIQRNEIWKALFGDTPVQSITSPFILSPTHSHNSERIHSKNTTTATSRNHQATPSIQSLSSTTAVNGMVFKDIQSQSLQSEAPPKMGFVPREHTMHIRDDIRRLQLTSMSSTEYSSDHVWNTDYIIDGETDRISNYIIGNSTTTHSLTDNVTENNGDSLKPHTPCSNINSGTTVYGNTLATYPSNQSLATYPSNQPLATYPSNQHSQQHHYNQNRTTSFKNPPITSDDSDSNDIQFDSLRSEADLIVY